MGGGGDYSRSTGYGDIPYGSVRLSSLYLTQNNHSDYIKSIINIRPSWIRGYPAFIYSIACFAKEHQVYLEKIRELNIRGIELTSEEALPYQIEKICDAFGTKVFLQYGHTEQCVFGYTYDETYRYRTEPLYGFTEVLDSEGRQVKEGEVGEVVVTTLHNRAFPLIRYRTGDYAEYGGTDSRYFYLNRVLGRTQDYIVNRDGESVLLTALIFGQHFKAMGKIIKWQLEQFEKGKLRIHLIPGTDYGSEDEQEIRELFGNLGKVSLEFDYTDSIPLTPRGKSKLLVQHMDLPLASVVKNT